MTFLHLLGRTLTEPSEFIRAFLAHEYQGVMDRYKEALFKALPEVPKAEIVWRFHFMLGATSYAIAGTDALRLVTDWQIEDEDSTDRLDRLVPRLMSFLLGGLRAPLPQFSDDPQHSQYQPMPRSTANNRQKQKNRRRQQHVQRHHSPTWVHRPDERGRAGPDSACAPKRDHPADFLYLPQGAAPDVRHRARCPRSRQRLVGRRVVPRQPDWQKLHGYPQPKLTPEEQSFLDNECDEACRLVDDWQVTHELYDLPTEAWRYIKDKGFLGMIIPKKYGGLEFSAYAHSQVVTKLSTRSSALSVSVMVPNSLGPAELLLHYGTEAQKNHYLPRLAKGIEVPAFALTSPWAGSDAASIPDAGVVCKGIYPGQGSARHARQLGQALHHAGPGVHGVRPGFPPV
jgi:hypothetical protein